jgi:hypothetical protein
LTESLNSWEETLRKLIMFHYRFSHGLWHYEVSAARTETKETTGG